MDQTKRAWLNRYIVKKRRAEGLAKRLVRVRSGSGSLRSPVLSGVPGSKRDTSYTEDISVKAEELEQRIRAINRTAEVYKSEILDAIDELEDTTRAEILERVFILDQSIDYISEDMDYSYRHIQRLLSLAVSDIRIPNNGEGWSKFYGLVGGQRYGGTVA